MSNRRPRSDAVYLVRWYGTIFGFLGFVGVILTGQFWALGLAAAGALLGFLLGEFAVSREDEESR